jgi:hypothetical protein
MLVDRLYTQARLTVSNYTPILGFILRSTNVRNAFEVHFPLKRIMKQIIGPNAKLLISSEWKFVPFTFPMTIPELPEFALIGGPASESGNILAIPVAGHELGHSVWRNPVLRSQFEVLLRTQVEVSLQGHPAEVSRLTALLGSGSRGLDKIRNSSVLYGMKQLEEIFCDAVGLYLFGSSFLYAIEYFLAPGGGPRSLEYPSDLERLRLLKEGSTILGLHPVGPLFERWTDSALQSSQQDLAPIVDEAVRAISIDVVNVAFAFLRGKGISNSDAKQVKAAQAAFDRGEPYDGEANLAEIVTAGWEVLRRDGGLGSASDYDRYRLLGETMLKSVEVSEFKLRVATGA